MTDINKTGSEMANITQQLTTQDVIQAIDETSEQSHTESLKQAQENKGKDVKRDSGATSSPKTETIVNMNNNHSENSQTLEIQEAEGSRTQSKLRNADVENLIKRDNEKMLRMRSELLNIKNKISIFFDEWDEQSVNKLRDINNINKMRWTFNSIRFLNLGVAGAGGVVSLTNHPTAGGIMSIAAASFEAIISTLREWNINNKTKWDNFTSRTSEIWAVYWILSKCENSNEIIDNNLSNERLKIIVEVLSQTINSFLNNAKTQGNMCSSWTKSKTIARDEFPIHLKKNWEADKEEMNEVIEEINNFIENYGNFESSLNLQIQNNLNFDYLNFSDI